MTLRAARLRGHGMVGHCTPLIFPKEKRFLSVPVQPSRQYSGLTELYCLNIVLRESERLVCVEARNHSRYGRRSPKRGLCDVRVSLLLRTEK